MARISASAAGGPNVLAVLDMIAWSELGSGLLTEVTDDGYKVLVGSTPDHPNLFVSYAQHPRIAVHTPYGWSDAAGRYQIMAGIPGRIETNTWDWASKAVGVADFTPASQDAVCIYLLRRCEALEDAIYGRLAAVIAKCSKTWASLPGAGYGQRENRLTALQQAFVKAGGLLA